MQHTNMTLTMQTKGSKIKRKDSTMYTRKTAPTPTSCIVLNECEEDTTWIYA